MRAFILAAARDTELDPLNQDRPRCMLKLKGRSILEHQVDAFVANGIEDIIVIGGRRHRGIEHPGVRVIPYEVHGDEATLMGMFSAGPLLTGEVLVSHGHIVFGPETVSGLLHDHACASLAVDRSWSKTHERLDGGSIKQPDLCETTPGELVTRLSPFVTPDKALGEFIGLGRFSSSLTARLWAHYLRARANGLERPFGEAPSLRQAHLTDVLNAAISQGVLMRAIPIRGGWRKIDTVHDLERAQAADYW